jgi:hypothetical protein
MQTLRIITLLKKRDTETDTERQKTDTERQRNRRERETKKQTEKRLLKEGNNTK